MYTTDGMTNRGGQNIRLVYTAPHPFEWACLVCFYYHMQVTV